MFKKPKKHPFRGSKQYKHEGYSIKIHHSNQFFYDWDEYQSENVDVRFSAKKLDTSDLNKY